MAYKKKGKTALWMSQHHDPTKSTKTGEWELFKRIAEERSHGSDEYRWVLARHLDLQGKECDKAIYLTDLEASNFSHIKSKGMYPKLRLEPSNIEIVSFAYHYHQHNGQNYQMDRRN